MLVAGENGSRQLSQALGVLNYFFFLWSYLLVLLDVLVKDGQQACYFIPHTHLMKPLSSVRVRTVH